MAGMADWQAQITIDVDDLKKRIKAAESELDGLVEKDYKVKLDIDTKTLESAAKKLDKMLDSLGKGTGDFKQFENLSKQLSSITTDIGKISKAFATMDDGSGLVNNIKSIDSSLTNLTNHFVSQVSDKMTSSIKEVKGTLSDVGNGKELTPLLDTIGRIESAIDKLSSSVKGIGLNMNIDFGSDKEMEAKAESKISNALQAYQRLFEHIKMSGAGGSIINTKFFDFDINQYDTAMSKLQAYRKFIKNMRNEVKAMYGGQDVLFTDTDKKYWTQASSAMGQVTKTFNEMKAASDTNPLENIFGKTDLTEVLNQLSAIVSKLDEISMSANRFADVFKDGLNVNASVEEIDKLTNRVKELESELAKIKTPTVATPQESNISSGRKDAFPDKDDSASVESATNSIKEENNVLEQNTQKVKKNTQAKKENANVNLNKYDKRLDSYNGKVTKYKTTIGRLKDGGWASDAYEKNVNAVEKAVGKYETLLNELKNKDASLVTNKDIEKLNEYESAIKKTIATVTNMSAAEKGYNALSGQKELDKINKILNENTKMSAKAKAQIKAFYKEIEDGNPSMSLDKIHTEVMKIYNAEVKAGRAGKSMWSAIKEKAWYGMASAIGTYFGFNDIIQYGKEALNVIKDLDTALVDLKKTTSMSATQLDDFYYDSNDVAKQMGVTTQEIIEQASAWSRLGYSSKEESTEMAKLSSQFASISPGMSTDESQEGLVSIMKAFDIDPDNVKSEIMDKVNTLGNNFAEDNQDVVEGLKRSAAAMSAMGQSFTDTAALFTGGMEILQDSESMGTALRTLSMRVRGYDEETNQLSDDLVNVTGEVANLTKTTKNAQGISLFTDASQEHYKSMVQYLGEIADEWNLISEKNQTELLQKLFGKNRANAGAAIIQNFDQVRAAIEAMDESAGSADKEMDTIENSLDYKLNALKETWVGTIQDLGDRGMFGEIISGLTGISDAIGGLLVGLQQISSLDGNISSLGGTLGTVVGLVQSLTGHGGIVLRPSL